MNSILFGKLYENTVKELSEVLFNVVYPTFEGPRSISSDQKARVRKIKTLMRIEEVLRIR
jgi:hypothetical protein